MIQLAHLFEIVLIAVSGVVLVYYGAKAATLGYYEVKLFYNKKLKETDDVEKSSGQDKGN